MAKKKLLIIEDDNFLAGLYTTKFELEGYEVIACDDGEKGLKTAKEKMPDVILLDILLPSKDGFEVLKELKREAGTKKIPVILLTNLSQKNDIQKGLDLGAVDYLIKSEFMPSEVIIKVNKYSK